jgi:hypothetical protein
LLKYAELGFTEVVLTNSSPDRDKLVKLVAEEIAPHFKNNKLKHDSSNNQMHIWNDNGIQIGLHRLTAKTLKMRHSSQLHSKAQQQVKYSFFIA